MVTSGGPGADERYLRAGLRVLQHRVETAIEARRRSDPAPDDRFRGLYVSGEEAARLFRDRPPLTDRADPAPDTPAAVADPDSAVLAEWLAAFDTNGSVSRLHALVEAFQLDQADLETLLVALGPDLDPRLEQAYGYLHDNLTRRRASIGLAIELTGRRTSDPDARSRFATDGPLVSGGLLLIEDGDRPFLTRSLRVPDVVAEHLLGGESDEPELSPFIRSPVVSGGYDVAPLVRALAAGVRLIYLRDAAHAAALSMAGAALDAAGWPVTALDVSLVADRDEAERVARSAVRRARLQRGGLVCGPVEALAAMGASAVRAFADGRCPVLLHGRSGWDPAWAASPALCLEAPAVRAVLDPALTFRLSPEEAAAARVAAGQLAAARDEQLAVDHLAAGARQQNAAGLERLALRVAPTVGWEHLVLPEPHLARLRELIARVRYRDRVVGEWRMRKDAGKGEGVTALFSGESGTGKTLAAEVVARELGQDLYVVDLSTVVDKYIGETEKNLDRIFREAERINGVLLFDEADALFGKRSQVQDARDRYANVEVSYLLQRMERFGGIAVLTTNLRANIDAAFLRRIDTIVEFPVPDEMMRVQLWSRHLPDSLPLAADVDVAFLARQFRLPGGSIRNAALSAAFLAAAAGGTVSMSDLVRGVAGEYRKVGRLCVEEEFGPYFAAITEDGLA